MSKDMTVRIGGESGEGVITAGEVLALASARLGLHVHTYRTYPAEMRGGPAIFQVRLGDQPVLSQGDIADVLLAFNTEAYHNNRGDVRPNGVLIYDADALKPADDGFIYYGLPLTTIATRQLGYSRGKNIVAVGALAAILGLPQSALETVVGEKLGRKNEQIARKNVAALIAGFDYVHTNFSRTDRLGITSSNIGGHLLLDRVEGRGLSALGTPLAERVEAGDPRGQLLLSGNQAIALGALAAGCKFFAGYPITPATDIMELLAAELPRFGGNVVQTEDEIAALSAAIGASYAGVKAMTATSGPGLSLMSELINLASTAEIPVVIVDSQRAGPSTGMPTKTEQSDLNHMLYGGHGEAPRIVIAPTSVEDAFYKIVTAFNLAERYQMPVIVAMDQSLSLRTQTIPRPQTDDIRIVAREVPDLRQAVEYKRYALTTSGVSARAIPSEVGGLHVATGLEHDEYGHPSYDPYVHRSMVAKRYQKLAEAGEEFREVHRFGAAAPNIGVVGWGSTEGAAREAVTLAQAKGIAVAGLYPSALSPLPEEEITSFARSLRALIVVEANYTGQFAGLLRAKYGLDSIHLNRFDGLPFTAEDIFRKIKEVADNG
ncbi:MAG: 2-oxoacid:acceptor oxidoreductase subunit alpha [Chloroflexi bacterium]|nr:2-oxoacid:acceptor oxidoreductase subunit alpha [Chloroflexota bacterium]